MESRYEMVKYQSHQQGSSQITYQKIHVMKIDCLVQAGIKWNIVLNMHVMFSHSSIYT